MPPGCGGCPGRRGYCAGMAPSLLGLAHPWNPEIRVGFPLGSQAMHISPLKHGGLGEHLGRQQEIANGKDGDRVPAVWLLLCPTVTWQHWGGGVGGISQNRNRSFSKVPKQPKPVAKKGREVTGLKSSSGSFILHLPRKPILVPWDYTHGDLDSWACLPVTPDTS